MQISLEEVDRLLSHDLVQYEDAVERFVKVKMAQHEFDALVSLCFNIGQEGFRKSSVVRHLNSGNRLRAANSFRLWNKGGRPRRVIKGLTIRRESERKQFLGLL